MSQSKQTDFISLADRLSEILFAKCSPRACWVSPNGHSIRIYGRTAGMIPHTVIVLTYRFALEHNLLMYFDTDNPCFVLH